MGVVPIGIGGLALGVAAIVMGLAGYKLAPPERRNRVKKFAIPAVILGILAIAFGVLSLIQGE